MNNKLMKILEKRLVKNFITLLSGGIFSSFIGVVNTILVIKILGLEKNGIIFLGLSYVGFFNTFFNFQSFDAIIKFVPFYKRRDQGKVVNFIKQGLFLDILTTIFAFSVCYLLLDFLGVLLKWNDETIKITKILIYTILFNITGTFLGVIRVYEKYNFLNIFNISKSLINLLQYIIIFFLGGGLLAVAYSNIITGLISFIILLVLISKLIKEKLTEKIKWFSIKFDKEFIKFLIYTNLSSTLDLPVFQLVPIIINKYLGLSEIAVYKILEKLGGIITQFIGVLSQVIAPEISIKIAEGKIKDVKKMDLNIKKSVLSLGVISMSFLWLTHKYWLGFIIPSYANYMTSIYLYLLFVIFTGMFVSQHPIFIYSGYAKYNVYILLVVNSIYLILILLFSKNFGLEGVVLTRIFQAGGIFLAKWTILNIKNKE